MQEINPAYFFKENDQHILSFKEVNYLKSARVPLQKAANPSEVPLEAALLIFNNETYFCPREQYERFCNFEAVDLSPGQTPDLKKIQLKRGDALKERISQLAINFLKTQMSAERGLQYDPAWQENYFQTLAFIEKNNYKWNPLLDSVCRQVKIKHSPETAPYTISYTPKGLFIHSHELVSQASCKIVMGGYSVTHSIPIVRLKIKDTDPVVKKYMETEVFVLKLLMKAANANADLSEIVIPLDLQEYKKTKDQTEENRFQIMCPRLFTELIDKVNDGSLSEYEKSNICHKLIKVVCTIHNLKKLFPDLDIPSIAHGDLKIDNIMLDDFGNPKVFDWGFAKLAGKISIDVPNGTPGYVPPECYEVDPEKPFIYDTRAWDRWSLGVVLYIVINGIMPDFTFAQVDVYNDATEEINFEPFFKCVYELENSFTDKFEGFEKIYRGFLRQLPADRMSIEKAYNISKEIYGEAQKKSLISTRIKRSAAQKNSSFLIKKSKRHEIIDSP